MPGTGCHTDITQAEQSTSTDVPFDASTFERLYREHSASIFSLSYRILGRVADAEDTTQTAFVVAFRELSQFRGECSLRTWLYRIAVNEALMVLRRRGRADNLTSLEYVSHGVAPDHAPESDRRLAVNASLERLKPEQRLILVLHYWEDLSCDEIREVLEVSISCVKMRLFRARADFRKHYGEDL